jgi:hypothetical protein
MNFASEDTLQLPVLQVTCIIKTSQTYGLFMCLPHSVYAYKYDTLPEHSAMQGFP